MSTSIESIGVKYTSKIVSLLDKTEQVFGLNIDTRGSLLKDRPVDEVCTYVYDVFNRLTSDEKQNTRRKLASHLSNLTYYVDRLAYYNVSVISFAPVEAIQRKGAVYDGMKRLRLRDATTDEVFRQRLFMYKRICAELEERNAFINNDLCYRLLRLITLFMTINNRINLSILCRCIIDLMEIYSGEYDKKLLIRETGNRAGDLADVYKQQDANKANIQHTQYIPNPTQPPIRNMRTPNQPSSTVEYVGSNPTRSGYNYVERNERRTPQEVKAESNDYSSENRPIVKFTTGPAERKKVVPSTNNTELPRRRTKLPTRDDLTSEASSNSFGNLE